MIKGVVDRIGERVGQFGKMYSIKLRDDNTWYGTKGMRAKAEPGSLVEFEAHQNAKGYWDADAKSLRVLEAAVAEAPTARAVGVAAGKDDYWKRREDRDLLNDQLRNIGAARNTAIAFVELLAKQEAIKWPAKQAEKAKVMLDLVEHYRVQFQSEVVEEVVLEITERPQPVVEAEWS